jgi:hypothetical protein
MGTSLGSRIHALTAVGADGRARRGRVRGIGLALIAAASVASAHTGGSTGFASIAVSGSAIRYSVTLSATALPADIAETLGRARLGDARARERLLALVRGNITLVANGVPCVAGQGDAPPPAPDSDSLTLVVDFACAGAVRDLLVRDDIFDVLGADHHTLAKVEAAGAVSQLAFDTGAREARVAVAGADVLGEAGRSFILFGVHHILSGWDHLLFLVALLLGGGGLVSLLKIVTAFTVAHSVTLSFAVLDVVVVPDRLVEAVIALSIAFVAGENLWRRPAVSRRWIVSFLFGLVHGFGFSSALRELALPPRGLVLSLVGFNLGVEAGQALVVAGLLPLLLLVRRSPWEGRLVVTSSIAILVTGVVLFVERVLFA